MKEIRARVLEKMEFVVFKSYLQRPKNVIFEGFMRRYGYGVLKNDEEEEERVERSWRMRGLERE